MKKCFKNGEGEKCNKKYRPFSLISKTLAVISCFILTLKKDF